LTPAYTLVVIGRDASIRRKHAAFRTKAFGTLAAMRFGNERRYHGEFMQTANDMNTKQTAKRIAYSIMNLALFGITLGLAACGGAPSASQNPNSPFEATNASESGPPMLKVENGSDITANVDCTGASSQSIVVPPGELREVRVPAGEYSCMLYGGDATPYSWSETYSTDMVYTFRAVTNTSYR
jgi:hypothetical protein